MKNIYILASLMVAILLAACSSPNLPEATSSPTPTTTDAVTPLTPTPEPEDAYPAPSPPAPAQPEGYPAPTIVHQLPQGYPGEGQLWIIRPAGQQCEDPDYADLATAVEALEEAGVTVLSGQEISLAVCRGCDCPTSEHYRILINADEFDKAAALDWIQE